MEYLKNSDLLDWLQNIASNNDVEIVIFINKCDLLFLFMKV